MRRSKSYRETLRDTSVVSLSHLSVLSFQGSKVQCGSKARIVELQALLLPSACSQKVWSLLREQQCRACRYVHKESITSAAKPPSPDHSWVIPLQGKRFSWDVGKSLHTQQFKPQAIQV